MTTFKVIRITKEYQLIEASDAAAAIKEAFMREAWSHNNETFSVHEGSG